MDIFPDFGAVGAAAELRSIIGALMTYVLIFAVLMLIISAVTWALASSNGHVQTATRARIGVLVAAGSTALAGCGIAWANFLLSVGSGM
ncbi:DUF6112 family protein [Agromyces aureus]|uniref:Integral membrane protein n=1 Tax=Agromyces aureus TaxID=453304 RepID=A0A191WGI7_9MICO|nr:DUF6112 family protein [Agromyces aureus]ANJ27371.1 hypothetical protein ATC03_12250 [Agromyces aureus]